MHTLNGHSTPAVWEASDEAIEWLSPEYAPTGAESQRWERQDGFEAEIWPALAAMIPAIISAAPAIINAVSSLVSGPKKPAPPPSAPPARPADPPKPTAKPAGPPMRTAQVARPAPARPVAAPAPTPTPAPAPPAAPSAPGDDLTTQVAALIPVLAALVANAAAPQEVLLEAQLGPLCSEVAQEAGGRPTPEDAETEPIDTEQFETDDAETDDAERDDAEIEQVEIEDIGASTIRRGDQQMALVPLPDRTTINVGVSPCPTSLLVAQFGRPRDELSNECQATTSAFWRDRMVTESVGPFRATGHRKAVGVFREAFAALKASHPDLHDAVGSAGMLCVRHVRGRPGVLSNHALGMALDLTIDGRLEVRDDDLVQRGLITIHEVFTRFGIFWGAGLRIEDAMHFEVGAELVTRWMQEGSI